MGKLQRPTELLSRPSWLLFSHQVVFDHGRWIDHANNVSAWASVTQKSRSVFSINSIHGQGGGLFSQNVVSDARLRLVIKTGRCYKGDNLFLFLVYWGARKWTNTQINLSRAWLLKLKIKCALAWFLRQWPVRQCHYEQASCWNGERFVFTMQNVVLHTCFGED